MARGTGETCDEGTGANGRFLDPGDVWSGAIGPAKLG